MGDIFTHAKRIDCPECPPFGKNKDRHHSLMLQSRNYSGSGTDMGVCPECGKSWSISYKVDEMERVPDWDEPSREAKEKEEAEQKAEEEREKANQERSEYERLWIKFGGARP